MKTLKAAAAALVVLGYWNVADVSAQSTGYLTDTRGAIVKSAFNLCWRTGYWSPALAVAECDPDLLPKPVPKPAPVAPAVAPPAAVPIPVPAPIPAAPAKPAAPAVVAPKRCDATVTLQNEQLFAFGKADVTAAAKARLDQDVLSKLRGCATVEAVVIEGHTDRLGSQQYNQKLSETRAENIKKYLVSKGVDAAKIETIGMGKTVPAKFCPDGEYKNRKQLIACLAPSRRAIISIKGPAK
jgi:OOP family OmpA-OmpF porin